MLPKRNIAIVGAGLVGSLLSIYLKKRGHDVSIYERRADMRSNRMVAGRSINLALSDRGFKGLEGVGLADEIRKIGIPMYARKVHALDGTLSTQPYGKDGQAIYSVSRGGLNCKLMDLAEENHIPIHFEHRCDEVDLKQNTVPFIHAGQTKIVESDLFIGADGAYSEIRAAMQKQPRFNYNQFYIEYGYKELTIPPLADGSHQMEANALHIWPRKDFMLIALPNIDGSFTCTLFFPFEGELSFRSLNTDEKIKQFMEHYFADAVALMPDYLSEFKANPDAAMVTVKCFPWAWEDRFLLIGDAAHAIVPFYGQGMNCGFEDCFTFNALLDYHNDWQSLLNAFEKSRKTNADAIAELALRNFVEMRDKVADPEFLLQKKIENWFSSLHPDKWMPLYSMVTFSHLPYAESLEKGIKQDAIMKQVLNHPSWRNDWQNSEVEAFLISESQKSPA